jgi:hypothetical protein
MTMPTHEIIYAGADVEQGPSLLRWFDGDEWYVAVIHADGTWSSLTVFDDETPPHQGARAQRA